MQINNTSHVSFPVSEGTQIINEEVKVTTIEFPLNNQEQVGNSGGKIRRRRICEQSGCRKRLTLAQHQMNCRCGKVFCEIHSPAEKHGCSFDYKAHHRAQLEKENKRKELFPDKSGGAKDCGLAY